jgi:hypothetical protein
MEMIKDPREQAKRNVMPSIPDYCPTALCQSTIEAERDSFIQDLRVYIKFNGIVPADHT